MNLLDLIPQQHPFRFVDEILEVDENHIVGRYQFQADADFYTGHFPGNPITPGVILLESMAQVGLVALGLYLLREDPAQYNVFFTDGNFEFSASVYPGDTVTIRGEKIFWRQKKLRTKVEMFREHMLIASGTISGIGVRA